MDKEKRKRYPADWKQISLFVRYTVAKNKCQHCGAHNHKPHPITGSKVILTCAHLNHVEGDCELSNLRALCQRCHLNYDRKDNLTRRLTRVQPDKSRH